MVMRIERLTVREIELPLRSPFVTAYGRLDHRRLLLVELDDGDGTTAWAECVAGAVPGYTSETVDSAWMTITEKLAPVVLGQTVEDPSGFFDALGDIAHEHPMARAAIEMACWDLAARREGLPLAELLGGTRTEVPAGIALGMAGTPDEAATASSEAVGQGYQRVKLKIQPGADLNVVRAVRERVGDSVALTVDANGAYTRDDFDHLAALDEFGLQMIEQPLPPDDFEGHADLQQRLATPVCLDESITTIADLEHMIALEAGRVVNLKPGRVGGFTTALTMVDRALAAGLDLWVGGMLETGIGRAHNVALASLDAFALPGDLSPSERYWVQDIVDPPWSMRAGSLPVPRTEPGMGVFPIRETIQTLTTRVQEIRVAD
jgi:O-succinylbenzoate synthase